MPGSSVFFTGISGSGSLLLFNVTFLLGKHGSHCLFLGFVCLGRRKGFIGLRLWNQREMKSSWIHFSFLCNPSSQGSIVLRGAVFSVQSEDSVSEGGRTKVTS